MKLMPAFMMRPAARKFLPLLQHSLTWWISTSSCREQYRRGRNPKAWRKKVMYELTDHELDAVTGAQGNGNGNAFGLVAVGLNASDFLNGNSVLNGNRVTVDVL